ncbi:g2818 [Coccomyxa elongata]
MSDQVQEAASRVAPDSARLADVLQIKDEPASGVGPGSSHSDSQKPGEPGGSPISPDYLVKLAAKAEEITYEVEKKQGGPSSPSFHAPQTPPSFNGRPGGRMEKPPATLRRDVQGREWTPEDVLMVAGKANLLPLLSAGGGLYNISKRAARNFNKLREVAGDELAILVAQRPETVIIIAHKEAEDSGGVLLPRGANGVTAWAQARASASLSYPS